MDFVDSPTGSPDDAAAPEPTETEWDQVTGGIDTTPWNWDTTPSGETASDDAASDATEEVPGDSWDDWAGGWGDGDWGDFGF